MSNYIHGLIGGSQCYFCEDGSVADTDDDGNDILSGADCCPELPDGSTAEVAPWESLGKVVDGGLNFEHKSTDIEGYDDSLDDAEVHGYSTTTLMAQNKKSYQLSTKSIHKIAFELSEGLADNDGRPYKQGWFYARHTDSLAEVGKQKLTHIAVYGRLTLSQPLKSGSSDGETAEYEHFIIKNSLAAASMADLETRLEA